VFVAQCCSCIRTADLIEVDLECPENNREVIVLTINDVLHNGNLYNCYDIALKIDMRDAIIDGRCTAFLVSANEVLVSYPAMGFDLSTDSKMRNARLQALCKHDVQVEMAQNIWINELRRSPARMTKRLLLRFPDDVMLSNVFNPNSYVLRSILPVDYASWNKHDQIKCASAQLEWRIADHNTRREATVEAPELAAAAVLLDDFTRMLHLGA
jgi:hypothetical protein